MKGLIIVLPFTKSKFAYDLLYVDLYFGIVVLLFPLKRTFFTKFKTHNLSLSKCCINVWGLPVLDFWLSSCFTVASIPFFFFSYQEIAWVNNTRFTKRDLCLQEIVSVLPGSNVKFLKTFWNIDKKQLIH